MPDALFVIGPLIALVAGALWAASRLGHEAARADRHELRTRALMRPTDLHDLALIAEAGIHGLALPLGISSQRAQQLARRAREAANAGLEA